MRDPVGPATSQDSARPTRAFESRIAGALVLLAVVWSGISVATPGYLQHDELEMPGFRSWGDFAGWTLALYRDFDLLFYRPTALVLMRLYANARGVFLIPHLAQALLHGAACVALYAAVRSFGRPRANAWWAAALFAALPLASFAVGWVAAVPELLFGLFLLVWIAAANRWVAGGSWPSLAATALAFAFSLTCKDTAIVGAGVAALLYAAFWRHRDRSRGRAALAVVLALGAAYLALRAPFVLHQLGDPTSHPAYEFSAGRIPDRLLRYFAFPFGIAHFDVTGRPAGHLVVPALWHASLVAALAARLGARAAALYLIGFFLPLAPVLAIGPISAHYLYASGAVVAVALSEILATIRTTGARAVAAALWVVPLLVHALAIEVAFYRTGRCQTRLLTSFQSLVEAGESGPDGGLRIFPDPGSPEWVLRKAISHDAIEVGGRAIPVAIAGRGEASDSRFDSSCLLRTSRSGSPP